MRVRRYSTDYRGISRHLAASRLCTPGVHQRQKLIDRQSVRDVGLRAPARAGLVDAVFHQVHVADPCGVGVDDDRDAASSPAAAWMSSRSSRAGLALISSITPCSRWPSGTPRSRCRPVAASMSRPVGWPMSRRAGSCIARQQPLHDLLARLLQTVVQHGDHPVGLRRGRHPAGPSWRLRGCRTRSPSESDSLDRLRTLSISFQCASSRGPSRPLAMETRFE